MSLHNEPIILSIDGIPHAWVPLDEQGTQHRQGLVRCRCEPLDIHGPLEMAETIRDFDFDKLHRCEKRL